MENHQDNLKYGAFWKWFEQNEPSIFDLEKNLQGILGEIHQEIEKVHPRLAFEISPAGAKGIRKFVISADGIKDIFDEVTSLVEAAPPLERWEVIAFRPRADEIQDVKLRDDNGNEYSVTTGEVKYLMIHDENPDKLGLVVYLPLAETAPDELVQRVVYLFLDQALGEYNVETKLGGVFIAPHDAEHFEQARPLEELADHVEAVFKQKENQEDN